jgi:hypothetical protein
MVTRVHIWHDRDGRIIAVGRPAPKMVERVDPLPAKAGHSVISTDVDEAEARSLIRTHRVDVASSTLQRKG